jgi:peptidoglycan/LPS O-acetylase OafA/YrhL
VHYKNNFSFLRFFFACLVIYYHTFILGGFGKEPIAEFIGGQETMGNIAVIGFFVISGYLVTKSLMSSPSLFNYLWKRFLRIYPGFWMCLLVTALFFAPIAYFLENSSLQGFQIFGESGPFQYIVRNFSTLIHQYEINNLLNTVPYKHTFDGSLWTLFLEVKAYLLLFLLAVLGITRKRTYMLTIFLILWSLIVFNIPIMNVSNKFVRLLVDESFLFFLTYFFAGVVYFYYEKEITYRPYFLILFCIGLVVAIETGLLHETLPFIAPYMIFYVAFKLRLQKFDWLGDYSYGLYIYAFPIQQLTSLLGQNKNIAVYFILCFLVSFVFAIGSWHFIEKPSLSLKNIFPRYLS